MDRLRRHGEDDGSLLHRGAAETAIPVEGQKKAKEMMETSRITQIEVKFLVR